jgi:hypothetical protein
MKTALEEMVKRFATSGGVDWEFNGMYSAQVYIC